jgi:GH15 family glucan-1,4-alpha-glucosidase
MQNHQRGLIFEIGPDRIVLDCPTVVTMEAGKADVRFLLAEGARVVFVLTYSSSTAPMPPAFDVAALVVATQSEWQDWTGRFEVKCRWDGAVRRSLITLRSLIDRESGGIVAAATLGLPEIPGGSANWDYRFCWLRDSTFMLNHFVQYYGGDTLDASLLLLPLVGFLLPTIRALPARSRRSSTT